MTELRDGMQGTPGYGAHRRAGVERGSCICVTPDRVRAHGGKMPPILPECRYHQTAARFPDDHSIPWNCPTYWDGCNCDGKLEERIRALAEEDDG